MNCAIYNMKNYILASDIFFMSFSIFLTATATLNLPCLSLSHLCTSVLHCYRPFYSFIHLC